MHVTRAACIEKYVLNVISESPSIDLLQPREHFGFEEK